MNVMSPATADETLTRSYVMNIYELTTLENLNNAFYECARASSWKESTQHYQTNLLINNLKLQEELRTGSYTVSPPHKFTLNERGKLRNIEAPAVRDRIIQKLMCQKILIPQLTKPLIYDNYASLKDRGTAFARKRIDILLRKYIKQHGRNGYVLQVDIKKYFESVDHATLKEMVHKRIKEPKEVMDLIDYMIDSSSSSDKGLNLGSEAPQIFAIYYLSRLDNYIKSVKGVKYYGRYMDDMFVFATSKEELQMLLKDIKEQLAEVKLEINEKKTHITKLSHGFTFMQIKYSISNNRIIKRPTHNKIVRERRRLKKFKTLYEKGLVSELYVQNCYKSWRNGVLKDCNAAHGTIHSLDMLYNSLFQNLEVFQRLSRNEIIDGALMELEVATWM